MCVDCKIVRLIFFSFALKFFCSSCPLYLFPHLSNEQVLFPLSLQYPHSFLTYYLLIILLIYLPTCLITYFFRHFSANLFILLLTYSYTYFLACKLTIFFHLFASMLTILCHLSYRTHFVSCIVLFYLNFFFRHFVGCFLNTMNITELYICL